MTIDLQDAQGQLEQLAEKAVADEEIVIARDGEPLVRLAPLVAGPPKRRLGSLEGLWEVPEDFDTMFQGEIEDMFYGNPDKFNR